MLIKLGKRRTSNVVIVNQIRDTQYLNPNFFFQSLMPCKSCQRSVQSFHGQAFVVAEWSHGSRVPTPCPSKLLNSFSLKNRHDNLNSSLPASLFILMGSELLVRKQAKRKPGHGKWTEYKQCLALVDTSFSNLDPIVRSLDESPTIKTLLRSSRFTNSISLCGCDLEIIAPICG